MARTNVNTQKLIWTAAETKIIFQQHRFWPSFIGAKQDDEKKNMNGCLPILLWPEQESCLDKSKNQLKKRKFEDDLEDIKTGEKKQRLSIFIELKQSIQLSFSKIKLLLPSWNQRDQLIHKSHLDNINHQQLIFSDLQAKSYFIGPGDAYGIYIK